MQIRLNYDANNFLKKIYDLPVEERVLSFDTEFDKTRSYYAILSLIQICFNSKEVFVFDAVKEPKNTMKIIPLFEDPSVFKMAHSCQQDIEAIKYFKQDLSPKNIIDTQILANKMSLGRQVSFKKFVAALLDKDIDKTSQYSKWLKRPLKIELLEYAAKDAFYLLQAFNKISAFYTDEEFKKTRKETIAIIQKGMTTNYTKRDFKRIMNQYFSEKERNKKIAMITLKRIINRNNKAKKANKVTKFIESDKNLVFKAKQQLKNEN